MNRRIAFLFLILSVTISISACKKKDSGTTTADQDNALFEAYNLLKDTYDKFFENAAITNGNPKQAIMLTDNWLNQQAKVASTEVFDSTYIMISSNSQINFNFNFEEVNPDGSSVYRGGAQKSILKAFSSSSGNCSHVINNNKVLLYCPVTEFQLPYAVKDYLSGANLEVTEPDYWNCTGKLLETFNQYGLVIVDTHGLPYGYMTSDRVYYFPRDPQNYVAFRDTVIKQIGKEEYELLKTGDLIMSGYAQTKPLDPSWWQDTSQNHQLYPGARVFVTSQYISRSPQLTNTIVFGDMCYSGNQMQTGSQTPIATAFLSRNPASYYGYARNDKSSNTVKNNFAQEMEDSLIRSLVVDKDSTGIAHLRADNTEFQAPGTAGTNGALYLKHFGSPSWCYGSCGDSLIDTRDAQTYPTVCIGNQVWMAKNLNWGGAGTCYDGYGSNCAVYGHLYTIGELTGLQSSSANPSGIQGICPYGWHVPSKVEWEELFNICGGEYVAGEKLLSTSYWNGNVQSTDAYHFSILPAGQFFGDGVTNLYTTLRSDAYFWTSDDDGNGKYINVHFGIDGSISWGSVDPPPNKMWRYSCRCVKDQ